MAAPLLITTQQILAECERMLQQMSLCNYAEVGRRLGVSRQTIQARLRRAERSGEITPEIAARYRPIVGHTTQRCNTSLTPENHAFVYGLAEQLRVPPATVIHAAVTRYRESLLDLPRPVPPVPPSGPLPSEPS